MHYVILVIALFSGLAVLGVDSTKIAIVAGALSVGVAYGSDKDQVRAATREAAAAVERTLQADGRAPQVWLVGFGDSSLNFELIVWLTATAVKRPARIAADHNWEFETALRKYGLEIPFPQRYIHVRSAPGLRDVQAGAANSHEIKERQ